MNPTKVSLTTFFAVIFTAVLWSAAPLAPAYAAGILVNTTTDDSTAGNGSCSLREAITNANNDSDSTGGDCTAGSGADTITFSTGGTITLGSALPPVTSVITIDGAGQSLIVSGDSTYRVFQVTNGASLTIDTLTIANGSAGDGGGIFNEGTLAVTNSTFSRNVASGGIYGGGAICNLGGTVSSINNSTFSENVATTSGGGGAIYHFGGRFSSITNSTFSDNIANTSRSGGGAISSGSSFGIIANSTFSGNRAIATGNDPTSGGAIINGAGINSILNSTFVDNSAGLGDAIFGSANSGSSITTVANTIIVDSTSTATGACVHPTPTNLISNLTNSGSSCWNFAATLDPASQLGTLGNNGGPTQTIALIATVVQAARGQGVAAANPAIDTGDAATCANPPVNGLDQRSFIRPAGSCDIGAFEFDATVAVTLGWFLAERSGDEVEIRWQTVTESGTAGFNLIGQSATGRTQLNAALIPSPVIDSLEPTDYSFTATTDATVFYLQELEIDGGMNEHGPFSLGEAYGIRAQDDVDADAMELFLPLITRE